MIYLSPGMLRSWVRLFFSAKLQDFLRLILGGNERIRSIDVSKNVRLFERKDKGYFHNSKMFNKKNDFAFLIVVLIC